MSATPILSLSGITKRFAALTANENISLDLGEGEILALLGENGAGKSTLMSVIFGEYVADEGHIEVGGHALTPGTPKAALAAGIGMVHQHFTLCDNLSVLENITLGADSLWAWRAKRGAAERRVSTLSERFGLPVEAHALVGALSVGERQRVEILKALYRDARILILDEPTAVLTPQESASLFQTLRQMAGDGLSIIFISHKLNEVLAVSDRIVVLRKGRVVADLLPAETNQDALAELMVGERVRSAEHRPVTPGAPVFALHKTSVVEHNRRVLDAVSLSIREREILGVVGVAGNGQRPLAELAAGLIRPTSGETRIFDRRIERATPNQFIQLGIGRIPEDRHRLGVIDALSLWENAILERIGDPAFSTFGWVKRGAAKAYTQSLIDRFDIHCQGPETRVALLSGGNMQKLILGRVFAFEPRFILANQPTRGLDVGASAFVQEKLLEARERGAAVLLISEDLDEVLAICDQIAVIYRGRLTAPRPASDLSARSLGLLMAGHWEEAHDAA